MNWKISKQFDFCYGHRVWTQQLNAEYSIDCSCACRHLHGHQGTLLVELESISAKGLENGMVTDFKHLNWFKKFVDDVLDHKMILDINDPLIKDEIILPKVYQRKITFTNEDYGFINAPSLLTTHSAEREYLEGLVFVNFVPTSENLTQWLAEIVNKKMLPLGVKVASVRLFETPKSQALYIP